MSRRSITPAAIGGSSNSVALNAELTADRTAGSDVANGMKTDTITARAVTTIVAMAATIIPVATGATATKTASPCSSF